ncbi:hypothetical protein HZ326_23522 [Fusarium oxysporum f. sp. albedinis]|nr:hypothetical protein HZ326_23522 [Fusarium oxysporum f. sp. albedinis]
MGSFDWGPRGERREFDRGVIINGSWPSMMNQGGGTRRRRMLGEADSVGGPGRWWRPAYGLDGCGCRKYTGLVTDWVPNQRLGIMKSQFVACFMSYDNSCALSYWKGNSAVPYSTVGLRSRTQRADL